MSDSAVHIIAHGRVQGVGFRFFVREQAARYSLTGWVKNLPDGTVEILAEGEKDILEIFIERVREGSFLIRVTDLKTEWCEPANSFANFGITF